MWPAFHVVRRRRRTTFHDVPEEETRRILGTNARDVFGFDPALVDPVGEKFGPSPADLFVAPQA